MVGATGIIATVPGNCVIPALPRYIIKVLLNYGLLTHPTCWQTIITILVQLVLLFEGISIIGETLVKKCKLVVEDLMRAQCSCGQWSYVGLTAEAHLSIKKLYKYHLPRPIKKAKRK